MDNLIAVCYPTIVTAPLDQKPTLQSARKAFARTHICKAARELFHSQGYAATTFDQIAKAAGTRRTTLYSHFRDKSEILEQIADEYQEGLCALIDRLDGPIPDRANIDAWTAAMVEFVAQERAPATLIIGLSVGLDSPEAILRTSQRFPLALAARIPAFEKTFDAQADDGRAQAWAKLVMRELSLACLKAARKENGSAASLSVAADMFEWFAHKFA